MTPIFKMSNAGGVGYVNRYLDMLAGNTGFFPSNFESIATVSVGAGGQSSITFPSIPSTYRHLQIRGTSVSSTYNSGRTRFNGDTTNANYTTHVLYGGGTSAGSGANVGDQSGVVFPYFSGLGSSTTIPTVFVLDILDYANTSKFKTIRGLSGTDSNGAGYAELISGLWQSTSAINSISITIASGVIGQNSTFALYGIK